MDAAAYIWPSYTGREPRTRIFWPEGIGEWETVREAKAKFPGHLWPRKPLRGYEEEADPGVMELRAAMERRQLEAWRRLRACERVVAAQDDARLRTILRQYYLMGRTQREVAETLNLSERTVNRQLSRFRREG